MAHLSRLHWLPVAGLLATLTISGAGWDQAQARSSRTASPRSIHGPSYRPPYAAIVLDDKSGQVLHEDHADDPRHPASLTKIMTLYMLFEQIEAGTLKLDTPLPISTKAAIQNPTKMGLKANQTVKVEDAIKGLVTKSANDAAVVVAEALGGSEEEFAKLMTLKARMLGMSSTTYVNASGLPAMEQITTARDQALLGHAIQHRFPVYYQYFATPSFLWRGAEMRNHNNLLGNVRGVDGIKTGYTEASGYNLVCSVRRDDRHIVAVVLGGTSNAARDTRMRQLIEANITLASTQRTAPIVVEGKELDSAPVTAMAPAPTFAPASALSKPARLTGVKPQVQAAKPAAAAVGGHQGRAAPCPAKGDTQDVLNHGARDDRGHRCAPVAARRTQAEPALVPLTSCGFFHWSLVSASRTLGLLPRSASQRPRRLGPARLLTRA
jgi:D-alanyl-D-alanine carboxypeptidase